MSEIPDNSEAQNEVTVTIVDSLAIATGGGFMKEKIRINRLQIDNEIEYSAPGSRNSLETEAKVIRTYQKGKFDYVVDMDDGSQIDLYMIYNKEKSKHNSREPLLWKSIRPIAKNSRSKLARRFDKKN